MYNIKHNIQKTLITIVLATTGVMATANEEAMAGPLADNTIYVTDRNNLYAIDKVAGTATVVADTKAEYGQIEDIAFDRATLYGVTALMQLYKYNDGTIYGINSVGDMYSIDPISGMGTLIHSAVVPGAYGMATSPASLGSGDGTDSGAAGGALSFPLILILFLIFGLRLFHKRTS